MCVSEKGGNRVLVWDPSISHTEPAGPHTCIWIHTLIRQNQWPWCQCILGAALIYHNTYLSDRKPQLMWPSQFAHTHTHFSFSIVCVARTVCVSRLHCSSWAKHTHTYAYKDTVSLPTVNSLLYNVHLLKHMEGQVILNERKHLSMLLFSCWACGDKTFQFKLSEYRKKYIFYIFSFAVFGLSEALYCIQ